MRFHMWKCTLNDIVIGLTMNLVETKADGQYFTFEHSHHYKKIQHTFWEAVDSMNPQNVAVSVT